MIHKGVIVNRNGCKANIILNVKCNRYDNVQISSMVAMI